MMYAAVRIGGLGVVGERCVIIGVSVSGGLTTLTTTGVTDWTGAEWSYVQVANAGAANNGRYLVTAGTATTVTIAMAWVGPVAGDVFIDDQYVICTSIPPGVGTVTRTRWHAVIPADGIDATIGAKVSPLGGVSAADGGRVSLLYRDDIAAVRELARSGPTEVTSAAGVPLATADPESPTNTLIRTSDGAALVAPDTLGQWSVGGEAIFARSVLGAISTVERGVLGTRPRYHPPGTAIHAGLAAAVGRPIAVTLYSDPTGPTDVLLETVGEVVGCGLTDACTRIEVSYSTPVIRPAVIVPDVAAQWLRQERLVAVPREVGTVSWVRFGALALRVRPVTGGGSGVNLYEVPPGLVPDCVRVVNPAALTVDDAIRLYGPTAARARRSVVEGVGVVENNLADELFTVVRGSAVAADQSWWTDDAGQWLPGRALMDAYTPEICHVFEAPGVHVAAIVNAVFEAVVPALPPGAMARSALRADLAALQVIVSTGFGAHGSNDLLPAVYGCAVPLAQVEPLADPSLLDPLASWWLTGSAAIGAQLTSQILQPSALIVTQTRAGGVAIRQIATSVPTPGAPSVTDASLAVSAGSGVPEIDGPEYATDEAVARIEVTEITPIGAEFSDAEGRTANITIPGSGASYGETMPQPAKVAVSQSRGWRLPLASVARTYGRLRHRVTVPVYGNAAQAEPGTIVTVSLSHIPGADGSRGFTGVAAVLERQYDRFSGLVRVTLLLDPLDVSTLIAWAPGGTVTAVTSETSFTISTAAHIATTGPALFAVGDKVNVYTQNLTIRSGTAPGTVATWDDTTGVMTLSVAASDGTDVLPVAGDVVTLAPYTLQPADTQDRWAWMAGTIQTRWL